MDVKRPYQYEKAKLEDVLEVKESVFIPLDTGIWKRPRILTLEKVGEVLQIKINDSIIERNVTSVESSDQEEHPTLPPNGIPVMEKTFISVDENYLYVWIPTLKKWKRTLLSSWD